MKCPGQDMRYWKPGDIFNAKCPECGGTIEFFKDESHRRCRCGHTVANPKLDFGCAAWCPYAEQCVGSIPEEMKAKQKLEQENSLRERISLEMKKYFGKDLKRVNHSLKVARHAEQIMKREGGNPMVVLGSAFLHDIGIHEAEARYQSTSGEYQEKEGPGIAREILERLNVPKEIVDEVCDIIGHHHHPREKETLNFQILYEADWLVNIEEEGLSGDRAKVESILERRFRTAAGLELGERLFLNFQA